MEGQSTPPSWRFTGSKSDADQSSALQPAQVEAGADAVVWTASEYIAHEKNVSWYVMFAAGVGLLAMFMYFMSRSIFSTAVLLVLCIGMGFYANRKPKQQKFAVSRTGVSFAGRAFRYNEFRSYAVVQDGAMISIWLLPLKRLRPPLTMYIGPQEANQVIDVIADYLPHEVRQHDPIERLTRFIRF